MSKKVSVTKSPIDLTKRENQVYRQIGKHLSENSALQKIDMYTVALAAKCYVRIEAMEDRLSSGEDVVQMYESGATAPSGLYTVLNSERKAWDQYCRRFGLTQEHREKILAFKADANNEPGIMTKLRAMRDRKNKAV